MLQTLSITNFALIDHLQLDFSTGMTAISGETGAGKSIILNAFHLICGGKFDSSYPKDDQRSVVVEALFAIREESAVALQLQDMGFEIEDELLLRREVLPGGRNKVVINSRIMRVQDLKILSSLLVNIHSQHQSHRLLQSSYHQEIFLEFGGESLQKAHDSYYESYQRLYDLMSKKGHQDERQAQIQRELSALEQELSEIEEAGLQEGEEEELGSAHTILVNQESIQHTLDLVREVFDGSSENSAAFLAATLRRPLEDLQELDEGSQPILKAWEQVNLGIDEVREAIMEYQSTLHESEGRSLFEIEERIHLIEKLKRKYGQDIPAILAFEKDAADRLFSLQSEAQTLESLDSEIEQEGEKCQKLATRLEKEKARVAKTLEGELNKILGNLAMEHARFICHFSKYTESQGVGDVNKGPVLGPQGQTSLEFYLQSNAGMEPQALGKTASGGEISRVMLALKQVFASVHPGELFVFDEIDTGIGGETAHQLGTVLAQISTQKQTFVISHLAQIVMRANSHFKVEKYSDGKKTWTTMNELAQDQIQVELARMMGIKVDDQNGLEEMTRLLKAGQG